MTNLNTNNNPEFGSLRKRDAREYWPHEGLNFTPWLADNISQLGETLGIDLELQSREAAVGAFSLDLLAHDLSQDRTVIIENQLEPTDHDHLGKLLTYAAGYDAAVVVWISREIREEHRQALDWLNTHTDEDTEFFGVVLEVLQIDDSRPAVNLKPVVFPNDWQKNVRPRKLISEVSERGEKYRAFFQDLLDELRERHQFTNARIAQPQSWYTFASGTTGLVYGASFTKQGPSAQLYIDRHNGEMNKPIFDALYNMKVELELEFGKALNWERLDNKSASRVAIYREGSIDSNQDELQAIHKWLIENLLKFRDVFGKHLGNVVANVESE